MKRIFICLISVLLCLSLAVPVYASDGPAPEIDGLFTEHDEITVFDSLTRSGVYTQTASKTKTVEYQGVVVATITLNGEFVYNGSQVAVVSKSVTTDLASGWSFTENSLTSSGGRISLRGVLSSSQAQANINMSLSCDANGNIT